MEYLMIEVLEFIAGRMAALEIPYEYGEWSGEVSYPYFVGNLDESEFRFEDGYTGGRFTLDGWTRESRQSLLEVAESVRAAFDDVQEAADGRLIFAVYSGCQALPTGEEGLFRAQITLHTRVWDGK